MLTENCVGSPSLRKRGPILTLCDPKWIHACAGMTKSAVAPAQAGPNWRCDSRFPHEWPPNDRIGRILDPGLRRDDDDIRWALWLDGDDLTIFNNINRREVL